MSSRDIFGRSSSHRSHRSGSGSGYRTREVAPDLLNLPQRTVSPVGASRYERPYDARPPTREYPERSREHRYGSSSSRHSSRDRHADLSSLGGGFQPPSRHGSVSSRGPFGEDLSSLGGGFQPPPRRGSSSSHHQYVDFSSLGGGFQPPSRHGSVSSRGSARGPFGEDLSSLGGGFDPGYQSARRPSRDAYGVDLSSMGGGYHPGHQRSERPSHRHREPYMPDGRSSGYRQPTPAEMLGTPFLPGGPSRSFDYMDSIEPGNRYPHFGPSRRHHHSSSSRRY